MLKIIATYLWKPFITRKTTPVCTAVDGGPKSLHYVMDFTQNTTKMRQAGTWDLLLQGLHLDTPLLQQWNTKKLQGTKTNYVHMQFGQIMDKRYKKTKKSNCHF